VYLSPAVELQPSDFSIRYFGSMRTVNEVIKLNYASSAAKQKKHGDLKRIKLSNRGQNDLKNDRTVV